MTNTEALKSLYIALGGEASEVADSMTNVDVLNAIAAKFEGDGTASSNSAAVQNITAVADNITGGGGADPVLAEVSVKNSSGMKVNINAYDVIDTKDGKAVSFHNYEPLLDGKTVRLKVPATIDDYELGTYLAGGMITIAFQTSAALANKELDIVNAYITEQVVTADGKGWIVWITGESADTIPEITVKRNDE